ncbi:hypothetical protein D9758_007082 [Tetrapyrgos nigripes]|uniref:Major facilitator superfamily (MFS) profile domain-containing protein n=1 Tax=Tetrapyrgos nigripes TaxID=182062 RepID=A0A8H5GDD6_9AGAR|nr:hypothetical protein D9758_007082 [Tetrapyrgos nigripes]
MTNSKTPSAHNEKPIVQHFDNYVDPSSDPHFVEEVASHAPKLRGRKLTLALAILSGTGFTLFGYDQGVMSALLTANQFKKVFPETDDATLQSLLVAIYEIGCLFGALSTLFVGDRLGRRRVIMCGCVIMAIGAVLQAASYSYAQMIVARIVTGLGNGMNWIDFAFFWLSGSSAQWRVPIALQIVFAVVVLAFIPLYTLGLTDVFSQLPESPRWLMKAGRPAEAMAVVSALNDKPISDPDVLRTYNGIREAVNIEGSKERQISFSELFTGGRSQNFRRISLGVVVQCFQQITGINLITYYATLLFERLGISDVNSRILAACNGTEYFLASLIAISLIDRIGRRKLMLFGAIGQCITMILLAILGSIDNSPAQIVSAVLLFVFNSFFAVGWLGMTWLYPAEITGLRVRGPANALSTASNWTFNFLVFAALNAFIVPVVYLFFPETAGRSLEDMDVVFALAHIEKVSPVAISLRKDVPLAGSKEAEIILGIEGRRASPTQEREVNEKRSVSEGESNEV